MMGSQPGGIFGYFIRSWRVTFLLIIGLAILGISTMLQLPRESAPEVKVPFGVVVTAFPGASARDVEELVTNPIEDRLENLSGVKQIQSTSRLGISSVNVEFEADEDLDEALRRLRESIDQVTDLPADAEDPRVVEISFSNEPIILIGLGGIDDVRLLTIYADELADRIATIPGVSSVTVVGARPEEVSIQLDPIRLADRGVSVGQVLGALRSANINAPFGQLETDQYKYDLRLEGQFNHVGDVAAVPVRLADGTVIPLDELADVSLVVAEGSSQSRISVNGQPSTSSVSLSVVKKTGGNIVEIVDEINAEVVEAQQDILPPEVTVQTFADRAEDVRRSLSDVSRSGLQTLLIVFVILWLFLGWQEALITALAIPLTFFVSFVVFEVTGLTLNGISLFSLILSLGLLVDNAIVIIEGIHDRPEGADLREHAGRVVDTFKKPLVGGTLTTVAAFFPMLLVSGIIGEFLRTIPIVVSSTLLASLFVALALIPPVAVVVLRKVPKRTEPRWIEPYFARFETWYSRLITRLLTTRRIQNIFITTMTVLLAVGLSLPFTGLLATGLFPAVDIDFMLINVELPPGARQEVTADVMADVEAILQDTPEITSYVANIGSSTSLDLGGGSSSENLGSFSINLNKDRDRTSLAITDDLREKLATISGATIEIAEISAGPPTASAVEVRLSGPDLDTLERLSSEAMDTLREISGTVDVDRSLRFSAGEFTFRFRDDKLAEYGISGAEVTQLLRTYVFGSEAGTFLDRFDEEVAIDVAARDEGVSSVSELLSLPIITPGGRTVTIGQIANVELSTSIDAIRHVDNERTISITSGVASSANANAISAEFQKQLDNVELPEDYHFTFGGEQQETEETFAELYRSMFISVILILIILVVEFNSYKQPLVIFLSIPMALIGVLFGLLILGGQLNFAAFIGLVSLTGIVVNDAIILVDRMNNLRAQGVELLQAVITGAKSRLQPVVLTTLTTAGGVAPLIWVDEFFRDMALTIITGLVFASILTLVFIPTLYLRQQQKIERKQNAQQSKTTHLST